MTFEAWLRKYPYIPAGVSITEERKFRDCWQAATAAERERCALIVDGEADEAGQFRDRINLARTANLQWLADAIRKEAA